VDYMHSPTLPISPLHLGVGPEPDLSKGPIERVISKRPPAPDVFTGGSGGANKITGR